MLDCIQFIKGSIAKKDIVPVLTHIHFNGERAQAFNFVTCVSYPFKTDFDATVPSKQFIKAVDVCDGSPEIVYKGNSLVVKKGKFKCNIKLSAENEFPTQEPTEGTKTSCPTDFITTLSKLRPFIADDASRHWSNGLLISNGYAYATNNIVVVTHSVDLPDMRLSVALVDEILRVKQHPDHILSRDEDVTAMYENGAWVKGRCQVGEWPDVVNMLKFDSSPQVIPPELFDAVQKVSGFLEDYIITFDGDKVIGGGAEVQISAELDKTSFQVKPLLDVLEVAENFELTPNFTKFTGNGITGMMANVEI